MARFERLYVANNLDNTLSVIDIGSNLPVPGTPVAAGNNPYGCAVDFFHNKIFVTDDDSGGGTTKEFDLGTNFLLNTYFAGNSLKGCAVDPTKQKLYVANNTPASSGILVLDYKNALVDFIMLSAQPVNCVLNAGFLYVTDQGSSNIWVINTANNSFSPIDIGMRSYGCAIDPVNNLLYVTSPGAAFIPENGHIVVINLLDNSIKKKIEIFGGPNPFDLGYVYLECALNKTNTKLYVANNDHNFIVILNTDTFDISSLSVTSSGPYGCAVDYVTNKLYVTCNGTNDVVVLDTTNDTILPGSISVGVGPIGCAVVNVPCVSPASGALPPAVAGVDYKAQLTAVGTVAWSAGPLPPGLTLNTGTGLISGKPTSAGDYSFSVTATGGVCGSATENYTLLVTDEVVNEIMYAWGQSPQTTINLPPAGVGLAYGKKIDQVDVGQGVSSIPYFDVILSMYGNKQLITNNMVWSAQGLPAGLTIVYPTTGETFQGRLTGIVTDAKLLGIHDVTITGTDIVRNITLSQKYKLSVKVIGIATVTTSGG
ncbi:MAG: hypothetical protein RLZ12_15 [Bacillota bacterium]|jgi:DNA-binding beta-propeller fold protein YncE